MNLNGMQAALMCALSTPDINRCTNIHVRIEHSCYVTLLKEFKPIRFLCRLAVAWIVWAVGEMTVDFQAPGFAKIHGPIQVLSQTCQARSLL